MIQQTHHQHNYHSAFIQQVTNETRSSSLPIFNYKETHSEPSNENSKKFIGKLQEQSSNWLLLNTPLWRRPLSILQTRSTTVGEQQADQAVPIGWNVIFLRRAPSTDRSALVEDTLGAACRSARRRSSFLALASGAAVSRLERRPGWKFSLVATVAEVVS